MFKIYDGREQFYQWDVDRKLIVADAAITQVHFCNRTGDCSLVCETYVADGLTLVDVPNILLQSDWRIKAYAYDSNYTKYEKCYEVIPRTKPADYVYTETETLNYNTLLDRIDEVDANIAANVEEYLKENPVAVDLSNYFTKEEANTQFALKDEVPTIDGLASEKYVDEKIAEIELIPGKDGKDGKDGEPGKDYVLTEADKQEIADMVDVSGADIDLSAYYTKSEIDDMLANLPVGDIPSGEEVGF